MARLNLITRRKVLVLKQRGYSVKEIHARLAEEDVFVSKRALFYLLKKYKERHTYTDLPKSKRTSVLNKEQLRFINKEMENDDECTAKKLHELLLERWPHLNISVTTIKRMRRKLGWVVTRPKYCQLIRDLNKQKRLAWCLDRIAAQDTFDNIIFSDECSIQLDSHGRLCFRKRGTPRKLKPKPKHPVKVHVWAGISCHGATSIVIFTGILKANTYCTILDNALIPFIDNVFPNNNYRFQQDNDPKHTSRTAQQYFIDNEVNWWKTPLIINGTKETEEISD